MDTVLARGPRFLLEQAQRLGLDRRALLRRSGLDDDALKDPDTRVPRTRFAALWRAVLSSTPDPAVGVRIGGEFSLRQAGLVGYAMLHSTTLEAALDRLVRFGKILAESFRPTLERVDRHARSLTWTVDPMMGTMSRVVDAHLTMTLRMVREVTRTQVLPREIYHPHPLPEGGGAHQRRAWHAPIRYQSERVGIVLEETDLRLPAVAADLELGRYLERYAETLCASLSAGATVADEVRRAIWAELRGGRPTLPHVAERLGTSPRSLQRRLREEGQSFNELLDELRHQLAVHLLSDRELAIHEISFLLGFSEPSTFYRAFRRWQDSSPQAYRFSHN